MRLIDADALISKLEHILNDYTSSRVRRLVVGAIISMLKEEYQTPTIDAEPVVHGYWLERYKSKYYCCSVCGGLAEDKWHNCPHCRAKMDEETKNDKY